MPCPSVCEEFFLPPRTQHSQGQPLTEAAAWQLLLDLSRQQQARQPEVFETPSLDTARSATAFLDLYRPLCLAAADRPRILGHLGQSIDGYIATASGDSEFVNDQENIRHLHRLRALHDAVIVGAGTIAADDPQLTTRHVPGPSPVRVIIDPQRRASPASRVFTDESAETVLVAAQSTGGAPTQGQAQVLFVPTSNGLLDLAHVVERLFDRGLRRLFVEGGGTTVSRFFDAGLLDRLQIAVAPVLTGRGKPGLRLAANESMGDCPRPRHRVFTMGQDILFDCDLRAAESMVGGAPARRDRARTEPGTLAPIRRIR